MKERKNYKRYYKKHCRAHFHMGTKRIYFFLTTMLILLVCTSFIAFYVLIDADRFSDEYQIKAETNQVVSIKKKALRTDFSVWNRTCDWNLIIVNNINGLPDYFNPTLGSFGEVEVDVRVISKLGEMIKEAHKNGIRLWVSSGYRNRDRQGQLFKNEVDKGVKGGLSRDDAINFAKKVLALPGNSEHGTGLCVDFNAADENFCTSEEYAWLMDNSTEYGFILRYPIEKEEITGRAYEPGHFRYVGEEHAKIIKEQNLSLEEYVSSL